jgi:poly(3-hydroxybutyrate) depolymerase
LEKNYWVDTQRVWATGKSDGAGFVNRLACDWALSKRIAAFAPVAGNFSTGTDICDADKIILKCNPGRRKIPLIEFHGAKDEKVVYGGGELKKRKCSPSIEHFMRDWAMRNSLGPNYIKTQPKRDTFVYKYGKDLEHGLVTLVVDSSIGHEWPVSTEVPT